MIRCFPGYDNPDSSPGACGPSEGCLNDKRRGGGAWGGARRGKA